MFKLISYSRCLPDEYEKTIDPVIQRNMYFASSENLLLSVLCDERKKIRDLGLRLVPKTESRGDVRKFRVPTINFYGKDYIGMISWLENGVTEPPMLKHISGPSESLK